MSRKMYEFAMNTLAIIAGRPKRKMGSKEWRALAECHMDISRSTLSIIASHKKNYGRKSKEKE